MKGIFQRLVMAAAAAAGLAGPVAAQVLMESYVAEIAPADRRNSSGVALSAAGAILAQDRANVHRFGQRQPGDTLDSVFTSTAMRAEMSGLLSRGSISAAAAAALRGGGRAVLEVSIWGSGSSARYITVDVAGAAPVQPADPRLTPAELARDAVRIQARLNALGFDAGPVDGQPGQRTRTAIAAFQRSIGAAPTGTLTRSELALMVTAAAGPGVGPSFSCGRAQTPTELAICGNAELAVLDRELAELWSGVQRSAAVLNEQRQWLAQRDACAGQVECLLGTMRGRVDSLGGALSSVAPAFAAAAVPSAGQAVPGAGMTLGGQVIAAAPAPSAVPGGGVVQRGGLLYLDGRLLWSAVQVNSLAIPQGRDAIVAHEQQIARRLVYAGWLAGADDLAASLADAPNPSLLNTAFDNLPQSAQARAIELGLSLSVRPEAEKASCRDRGGRSGLSCVSQMLQTEFDRRRFQRGLAGIIAETAEAERIDLPLDVVILCPIGRIDTAYDFDDGTVNWAEMIRQGNCVNPVPQFTHTRNSSRENHLDLARGVPDKTPMPADQVERLARSYQSVDAAGRPGVHPLILAFEGQLTAERTEVGQADPLGLMPIRFTLRRTGPVSLRSSAAPLEVIAQFEGPSGDVLPTEALDLSSASDVFKLMEAADALDPARLAEAVAGAQDSGGGGLVRLRAYAASGGDGPPQLSIANFFGSEEPALRVAAMIGQPIAHVGWDQLLSHERGVPDTEVVLVFPAPFAALSSVPIDDAVFEAARRGSASMIARLSAPMQMPGAVGPSLVAVVTPLMYEVYEDGIGGAQRVLARPELSEAEVAPQQSVFLPSGWWYVLKGAELKGVDLDTHIAAVFDRARLFRGDTFARLDAIEAARATLDTMPAEPPEGGVWVAGRATLGAYDLERRGWPLRGLNIVMPSRDRTEESIARRVGPEIVANDLVLPMPMDEARAFQEQQGSSGQLDFYARLDLSAPESASDLNVRGHLREMLLFPPSGSSSQRMQVSPAFDRSRAIASFEFPAEAGAAPAETLAAAAPVPVAAPAPAPAAPAPEPAAAAPAEAAQPVWPEVPELGLAPGAWDILGLRTGIGIGAAHDIIVARGGVLAAFEKPLTPDDPATVNALRYQRIYVAGDGTEAITLAAPGPDGPVLAVMRRLQLPRGALPFDTIRSQLIGKYGPPTAQGPEDDVMSDMFWVSGTPGPRMAICRAHLSRRIPIREWRRLDGIGSGEVDLSVRPAAWDWAVSEPPVDYAEQMSACGDVLSYAAEDATGLGGAAFSMLLIDADGLRQMDEALAGVPEAGAIEIDF